MAADIAELYRAGGEGKESQIHGSATLQPVRHGTAERNAPYSKNPQAREGFYPKPRGESSPRPLQQVLPSLQGRKPAWLGSAHGNAAGRHEKGPQASGFLQLRRPGLLQAPQSRAQLSAGTLGSASS